MSVRPHGIGRCGMRLSCDRRCSSQELGIASLIAACSIHMLACENPPPSFDVFERADAGSHPGENAFGAGERTPVAGGSAQAVEPTGLTAPPPSNVATDPAPPDSALRTVISFDCRLSGCCLQFDCRLQSTPHQLTHAPYKQILSQALPIATCPPTALSQALPIATCPPTART